MLTNKIKKQLFAVALWQSYHNGGITNFAFVLILCFWAALFQLVVRRVYVMKNYAHFVLCWHLNSAAPRERKREQEGGKERVVEQRARETESGKRAAGSGKCRTLYARFVYCNPLQQLFIFMCADYDFSSTSTSRFVFFLFHLLYIFR